MRLLCTDLDRTLLPNGEQSESALARPLLWHMLNTHDIKLAYVSGRDLGRVLDAIDEYGLQVPDIIVADVGSSIYLPEEGSWVNSETWQSSIATDWNGLTGDDIKELLNDVDGLTRQEPSRQSMLKTSYYFPLDTDRALLRKRVKNELQTKQVNASLVMSDDLEKQVGLLDVLPRQATKSGAVSFIRAMLGVAQADTLFAGDSGNDVAALVSGVASVAVANADADTRGAIERESVSLGTTDSTFQAVGGLNVAGNVELNGNYAAGILEGLMHFRPVWRLDLLEPAWVASALARYPLVKE